ncbi:MAG TPA: S-layer homology domain-containing protein [Acidimicrobiales bacterium]|nr:S-layer homology domain-containing protein [Acidimicrobiales bacterium]
MKRISMMVGLGLLLALHSPVGAMSTTLAPPGSDPFPSRSIALTCPAGEVPPAGFADVAADNVHGPSIDCLRHRGLTQGVGDDRYLPAELVSRGQMAAFVARLVEQSGGDLPDDPADAFADDDGSVHEASIDKLAAVGVVTGTGGTTYDPHGEVSRDQMASLMIRAVEHRLDLVLTVEGNPFSDDDGSVHETSINKAAWAGVVVGLGDGRYGTSGLVRRDQVASFAIRALDLVITRPSWERAVELIHACQVEGVFQAHDLSASLELKDGTSHRTTQPHIDAVAGELGHAGCPGPVRYATE